MREARYTATFHDTALEHLDALYGYALALTHDGTEAEDLVQETYLRAARAFGSLVADTNLKSWLFVIMRNAWLNELRHQRRGPQFVDFNREEQELEISTDWRAEDPHVLYLRKLDREKIRKAIESLPHLYREIIVLRDIEGFTYKQIASLLDCPAGTVMSRLGRAREKLRRLLSGLQTANAAKAV